jgi:hypothetical protein
MTVASQENTILTPIARRAFPIGLFLPNKRRRKKPRTVGGNTIGSVNTPSSSALNRPFSRITPRAAKMPSKKAHAVAASEVFIDMAKGDQSIYFVVNPYLANTALAPVPESHCRKSLAVPAFALAATTAAG